jgi:hypothetical protein
MTRLTAFEDEGTGHQDQQQNEGRAAAEAT